MQTAKATAALAPAEVQRTVVEALSKTPLRTLSLAQVATILRPDDPPPSVQALLADVLRHCPHLKLVRRRGRAGALLDSVTLADEKPTRVRPGTKVDAATQAQAFPQAPQGEAVSRLLRDPSPPPHAEVYDGAGLDALLANEVALQTRRRLELSARAEPAAASSARRDGASPPPLRDLQVVASDQVGPLLRDGLRV
eukprot:6551414-Prymnesium_polylepis.1